MSTAKHSSGPEPSERPIPEFASALIETLRGGYSQEHFRGDLLAGVTVGIVAVPLAMALAIASGVPPQHGLYTAIVAGAIIALTGGARLSISGPTAAFVVILLPITVKFGLGGLMLATVMAGLILVFMGVARLGRFIEYIPYPVTTGFTGGIAVVLATLQLKDFLGLNIEGVQEHYLDKLAAIVQALPTAHMPDIVVGATTLAILIAWPRLGTRIPGHLVALVGGTLVALLGTHWVAGFDVATIGSRFTYVINGIEGHGIPQLPPLPVWPWAMPDANGQPIGLSLDLVRALIGPAFAIAMLGAIESLLCAVVADGLAGTKHRPNGELIGQGLGNIIAPFFGGITATAAIARTATNIRAGARSPLAGFIHAMVVLAAVVILAEVLAWLPMAALAAVLIIVAWNISEARHFVNILRVAPRSDVAVLLACFGITVFIDMVAAVSVGVVLASLLFIHRMANLGGAVELQTDSHQHLKDLPRNVAAYQISGPLFFGAAEKALSVFQRLNRKVDVMIVDIAGVPVIDMTGVAALDSLVKKLNKARVAVILAGAGEGVRRQLLRAGFRRRPGALEFADNLPAARVRAERIDARVQAERRAAAAK